ncbi:phosphoprotein [bank vole virus 1]|uniref:Phosphoprotein n=1 Tax=bank vole virus 1 TaxID=2756244 RepID=A0A2H4PJ62_9MONO|nr:phosphoprotein [bank vole virus 1]ATW63185.1 phosphoprotein [bank vole virus 1]
METNCQTAIKDALKIMEILKETPCPQTKEQLSTRVDIADSDITRPDYRPRSKSEDRSTEKSRSSRGRETDKGTEARPSSSNSDPIKRPRKRLSRSSSAYNNEPEVLHTSVCQDNPHAGDGGASDQQHLGPTGGGIHMHHQSGGTKPEGSSGVGEEDDGGSGSYIEAEDLENPNSGSSDDDEEPTNLIAAGTMDSARSSGADSKNLQASAVDDSMTDQEVREALGACSAPPPRRLTGLGAAAASLPTNSAGRDHIKRGIEGSTTSSGPQKDSWSNHGVIPAARGSDLCPSEKDVDVATAQGTARSAWMRKQSGTNQIGTTDSLLPPSPNFRLKRHAWSRFSHSSAEGSTRSCLNDEDSSVASDSPLVLISEILDNQKLILDKLKSVDEIKHEIDGIKKMIARQGLTLATLEGQISSVMIAVPSYGAPTKSGEINPDLKPLLGRDKCRALTDVTRPHKITIDFDNPTSTKTGAVQEKAKKLEIKPGIIPEPLNDQKTNASGFKPVLNMVTKEVIAALIDMRVKDKEAQSRMKKLLHSVKTQTELNELHKAILQALKRV